MSKSTTTASVCVFYFEHQDLTHIHGDPTFNTLHSIVLQLNIKATSVPKTLGSGAHGCAGDVLSPITYAALMPLTPFAIPTHPGPLNLMDGATRYVIYNTQTVYGEHLHTIQQYQLVQKSLIQKVLEAIEAKFII